MKGTDTTDTTDNTDNTDNTGTATGTTGTGEAAGGVVEEFAGRPTVYGDSAYGSAEFQGLLKQSRINSRCRTQAPAAPGSGQSCASAQQPQRSLIQRDPLPGRKTPNRSPQVGADPAAARLQTPPSRPRPPPSTALHTTQ